MAQSEPKELCKYVCVGWKRILMNSIFKIYIGQYKFSTLYWMTFVSLYH